jgi:hypothetical protein
MNPMIPDKPGWWWLKIDGEKKPVEVFLEDNKLVMKRFVGFTISESEVGFYNLKYEIVSVEDVTGWRGFCFERGPYDMLVMVPELSDLRDCERECFLHGVACDLYEERPSSWSVPSPGCPRYEK